jgi:hypothetical protein
MVASVDPTADVLLFQAHCEQDPTAPRLEYVPYPHMTHALPTNEKPAGHKQSISLLELANELESAGHCIGLVEPIGQ